MHYVLVYLTGIDIDGKVLLLYKNRPSWQAGKLNLPGGQIEQGETVVEAAIRETKEETGLTIQAYGVEECGQIIDGESVIHCVRSGRPVVTSQRGWELETKEDQIPEWMHWCLVKDDPRLIPNLKLIIPLMEMDVKGWEIHDDYRSKTGELHEIKIKIPDIA